MMREWLHCLKASLYVLLDTLALAVPVVRTQPEKPVVLLIRVDAIGDFVLWLDTAKEYRKLYPSEEYRIVLVGNKLWGELAESLPYWDEIIAIDPNTLKSRLWYRRETLRRIRSLNAVVAIQPTYSSDIYLGDSLVRASAAKERIGFTGDLSNSNLFKAWLSRRWYTRRISASLEPKHELERNAEFLGELFGVPHQSQMPQLSIGFDTKPCGDYFVVVPGAGRTLKEWPLSSFVAVLNQIQMQWGWHALIIGGSKDEFLGSKLQQHATGHVKNLAGKQSLSEVARLLKDARLVISNDTGAAHMATAMKVTTICILGGGHYGRFMPYPKSIHPENLAVVHHHMPCYSCNWGCIYSISEHDAAPCVSKVTPESVLDMVDQLIPLSSEQIDAEN